MFAGVGVGVMTSSLAAHGGPLNSHTEGQRESMVPPLPIRYQTDLVCPDMSDSENVPNRAENVAAEAYVRTMSYFVRFQDADQHISATL